MKRPFAVAVCLLCCSLAFAQEAGTALEVKTEPLSSQEQEEEAESRSAGSEISVTGRAEYLSGDDILGNSCLYVLADGNLSEVFSYSASLHLLSSSPADLYSATFHPNESSWLDWAYISAGISNFEISLGKDMLLWGTYEMEEYDFDIHYPLASSIWNCLPIYQWGAKVGWSPAEDMEIGVRLSSSPFSDRPFDDGTYALGFRAKYDRPDAFGLMVAYNSMDGGNGSWYKVLSSGIQGTLGNFRLTADFNSKIGDESMVFAEGISSAFSCTWKMDEKLEVLGKLNLDDYDSGNLNNDTAGMAIHWYPLKGLRVHAVAAYRFGDFAKEWNFGIGATYRLDFSL